MNVLHVLTTANSAVRTDLVPTPVPATVDTHWQLMDDPALLTQQLHLPQLHLQQQTVVAVEAD